METKELILRFAQANPRWVCGKIQGELIKLAVKVSHSTIRSILMQNNLLPAPVRSGSIGWIHLMAHYKDHILACDFFTVETIWLKTIYVLFFMNWVAGVFILLGLLPTPTKSGSLSRPDNWFGNFASKTFLSVF